MRNRGYRRRRLSALTPGRRLSTRRERPWRGISINAEIVTVHVMRARRIENEDGDPQVGPAHAEGAVRNRLVVRKAAHVDRFIGVRGYPQQLFCRPRSNLKLRVFSDPQVRALV